MAKEIKLPQLGKTMEEGIIINCLVKVGQKVKKGDFLFEIETDKVTFELESPEEGFVKAIIAEPGQAVSVGEVLLILGEENEKTSAARKTSKKIPAENPPEKTSMEKITPADLAAAQNQAGYKLGQKVPLDRMAKKQAEKMLLSKREKPCFYLNINIDMTELAALREKLNVSAETKISINDFIIRALSLGLTQWPVMTGRLENDSIQLADSIDIAFSIAAKSGLINAVIKEVDKKNLIQIAQEIAALIEKAEKAKLMPDELEGGCITLSNLGELGIDSFIPIVEPEQCSILGVGKITDTCVLEKDNTIVRKSMKMTIAVDHKIANGAEAAQFLSCVGKLLEDPKKLI
ncbi:MAG: dihydrolipoamide acetyltransferase family protein [Sedimentisphaerales bacterium]